MRDSRKSGPAAACLPGEEPIVDLDAFERAGKALVATVPEGDEAD